MNLYRACLLIWSVLCLACLPALWAQNDMDARPQAKNLAAGKTVALDTPANYADTTDPEDILQLTDGKLSPATPIWYDKSTVGWLFTDPTVFSVDLGEVSPIRGVALHVGAGQAGVEWPTSIQVYVSDDGDRYSRVGDLMELLTKRPPEKGYASLWLTTDKLETHGRHVKFVCTPTNLGNGAYIMLDEVEVYEGEAEWLSRPLIWSDAPQQWRAAWDEIKWRDGAAAISAAERPRRLLLVDGDTERGDDAPLQQAVIDAGEITFSLNGEAGKPRRMSWTGALPESVSTANCRFALMTFRAEGIRRTFDVLPMVALQGVNEKSAANAVTLLEMNMAMDDGLSHTLVKPLPEGFIVQQVRVMLYTEDDSSRLTLERLEFLNAAPDVFGEEIAVGDAGPGDGLIPVQLGTVLDGTLSDWYEQVLAKHKMVLDGARNLQPGPVRVSGVPFVIGPGVKNLAIMPQSPEINERVEFLGQTVDSRNLGPESRNDTLSVDVDARAREAFLLVAVSAPPVQTRGGIPYTALRLDDIECLSVELTYDQGRSEIAFPYSLADRECCIPARELGAYAVAVDPARQLKKVTLHARQFGLDFALAGLTLNTSGAPIVPGLVAFPAPESIARHPEPAPRPVTVTRDAQRIVFSNRWYEYTFDLTGGFALARLVNRWNPSAEVRLLPSSGLRVRVGDTIYTGRCFRVEVVRVSQTEAELRLTSTRAELPLEIAVTIAASDSPELSFAVQIRNPGDAPLAPELCLPAFEGLALGDLARTRLLFPQYRTVDTAEDVALRAPYGPEFATQFMDVYSRPAGIGLMVRTDNPDQRMADFTLRKDASGVAGGVCFPAAWNEIAPGEIRAYPAVSLLAHGGDWHEALDLYRNWVRGWYKPHESQDKEWLLSAWDMQCYRASEKLSWREAGTPGMVSPDKSRFLLEGTFALDKQAFGHLPDVLHFYDWTHNNEKNRNEYGVHSTPLAYEQVGGLELFRQAIDEIQNKWQRPVSLYTLTDRFRASALPDQELSRALAASALYRQIDADASAALRASGQADGIVFPRFGDERWTNFFIEDIAQMQRDTGCKMVYMDVMPRFSHLRGIDGVSPREDDINVVKRMRQALPADVALWSEYPFTDVGSQYADGCVQYYFLDLNEAFARRYNWPDRRADLFTEMPLNIGRYVFTRYKTFCLPVYIEAGNKPSQVDAAFVNGEPFHEDMWRLHHSRLRTKINRSYVVKREYPDCFGCENPMPRVATAAAGITANLFPGKDRALWTVFNERPKTYSGVVLDVPHRPGATYCDAWNGVELKPVIDGGVAHISLTVDPQQPGCVVQDWAD